MAGDEQRQRIPAHGLTNRTTGLGGTGRLGQLPVGSGFTPGDRSASPTHPAGEIFPSRQPRFQVNRQPGAPPLNGEHQILVEAVHYESLNWGGGLPAHFKMLMFLEHHRPEWGGDSPNANF